MASIRRLLVANRGEIACRLMRTAKRMNIETVAIYSAADSNAMHVRYADESYYVGEAEPRKSYLNQEKILEIAHDNNVTAIHPGYGFLSENAEFSQRCQDEKLIFVGPRASSIRSMGIKNESKRIMIEAGVPVVPGYHGLEQENELLLSEAIRIGFPVLIKPVRGGGGKGMRVVQDERGFLPALESARRESLKSFNDQSMLLEKYIVKPRHIEVQVFGDSQGNYVHLFERDCSVQRRHQKIIEEAPAPLISGETRKELGEKAIAAAKAVGYLGAGTVEFILDKQSGEFYFMEMNTRLQVEHPITEMITDTDLVEWQLRVASGECLPKKQDQIKMTGHSFEARIYAENPNEDFLPQTGQLKYICLPDDSETTSEFNWKTKGRVRLDTGVCNGDVISPYYDPMIAKLIVWDEDRQSALQKLNVALRQYVVIGLETNIDFLSTLASNKSFQEADVGTDFIDLHKDELFKSKEISNYDNLLERNSIFAEVCASICKLLHSSRSETLHKDLISFRIVKNKRPVYKFQLKLKDIPKEIEASYESMGENSGIMSISFQGDKLERLLPVVVDINNNDELNVKLNDGKSSSNHRFFSKLCPQNSDHDRQTMLILRNSKGDNRLVRIKKENLFSLDPMNSSGSSSTVNQLVAVAPMPGIIEKLLVGEGDEVKKGQNLIIMSAMKMEYSIKSGLAGRIGKVNCKCGEFVTKDSVLVEIEKVD